MLRRALVTTGIVGVVLAMAASPAAAGKKKHIDLRAKGVETEGKARAVGTLHWQSKFTKHGKKSRAVFKGRFDDKCKADGYSAVLTVNVSIPGGVSYKSKYDERGCEAKAMSVVMRTGWVKDPQRVYLELYEYKSSAGDIARDDEDQVFFSIAELEPDWR